MTKVEHSFNEHGTVDSTMCFSCATEAIEYAQEFEYTPKFSGWNVKPVDEKDLKKGFVLTIRRLP